MLRWPRGGTEVRCPPFPGRPIRYLTACPSCSAFVAFSTRPQKSKTIQNGSRPSIECAPPWGAPTICQYSTGAVLGQPVHTHLTAVVWTGSGLSLLP